MLVTDLQTDFAWPETEVEREIIQRAGHEFVVAALARSRRMRYHPLPH